MFKSDDFWQFSVGLYAENDVKHTCLALQEQHKFNVNVLLLACYLNRTQHVCSESDFMQLIDSISESEGQLHDHRRRRKDAKSLDANLYRKLLTEELCLEKQQQQTLIETLNSIKPHSDVSDNLVTYATVHCKAADQKINEYLNCLYRAAEEQPIK